MMAHIELARIFLLAAALCLVASAAYAQTCTKVSGWAQRGGQVIVTAGTSSTTKAQKSYPSSTVTVYATGTVTLKAIFTDSACSVAKANPFTASATDASYGFYVVPPELISISQVLGSQRRLLFLISVFLWAAEQRALEFRVGATATTIANTLVLAGSSILVLGNDAGITGRLYATNIVAGGSFDVVSENGADAGNFTWIMF